MLFLLYTRWLLKSVVTMNEDMSNISVLIKDFSIHVKSIHELEMFYGDETLASLMKHSSELSEKLEEIDLILTSDEEGEEFVPLPGDEKDE